MRSWKFSEIALLLACVLLILIDVATPLYVHHLRDLEARFLRWLGVPHEAVMVVCAIFLALWAYSEYWLARRRGQLNPGRIAMYLSIGALLVVGMLLWAL